MYNFSKMCLNTLHVAVQNIYLCILMFTFWASVCCISLWNWTCFRARAHLLEVTHQWLVSM